MLRRKAKYMINLHPGRICKYFTLPFSLVLFVYTYLHIFIYTTLNKEIRQSNLSTVNLQQPQRLNQQCNGNMFKNIDKIRTTVKIPDCKIAQHPYFPLCREKVTFMERNWMNDECYFKVHRINGSRCSIYHYLTQVEPYCMGKREIYVRKETKSTSMKYQLTELLNIFNYKSYRWMKNRIKLLWPSWLAAATTYSQLRIKRRKNRMKVVVFAGGLTYNTFLLQTAGRGTPLGELVQWSDLTTALYLLGHEVNFITKISDLINRFKSNRTECPLRKVDSVDVDVIYTDINGVRMIGDHLGSSVASKYRCMLRVLDSFGTLPEFNFPDFIIPGINKGGWSNLNLIPTQFLTFYPHTHDNLFLGFVIQAKPRKSIKQEKVETSYKIKGGKEKKPKALIYAKGASYTKGYWNYLKIVSEYFQLHATCIYDGPLPSFIHNHGPVTSTKFQQLLSDSKLFVGVGFPFEGPGPLEAMANGAIYLQPKFVVPVSQVNHNFFLGKPTSRRLSSQNPYMEEFVGEPYCFTIDVNDEQLLRQTLRKIKSIPRLPSKIPKEFTNEGFIERVHAFTEYVNYCDPYAPVWPPIKNLHTLVSKPGQSCKALCLSNGMICERSYFTQINNATKLIHSEGIICNQIISGMNLHAPSVNVISKTCFLQTEPQMFSCMSSEMNIIRLCPCRDYEREQSAICRNCM